MRREDLDTAGWLGAGKNTEDARRQRKDGRRREGETVSWEAMEKGSHILREHFTALMLIMLTSGGTSLACGKEIYGLRWKRTSYIIITLAGRYKWLHTPETLFPVLIAAELLGSSLLALWCFLEASLAPPADGAGSWVAAGAAHLQRIATSVTPAPEWQLGQLFKPQTVRGRLLPRCGFLPAVASRSS